jgi:hypothetical protein
MRLLLAGYGSACDLTLRAIGVNHELVNSTVDFNHTLTRPSAIRTVRAPLHHDVDGGDSGTSPSPTSPPLTPNCTSG